MNKEMVLPKCSRRKEAPMCSLRDLRNLWMGSGPFSPFRATLKPAAPTAHASDFFPAKNYLPSSPTCSLMSGRVSRLSFLIFGPFLGENQ
jgi:hypothetical protein